MKNLRRRICRLIIGGGAAMALHVAALTSTHQITPAANADGCYNGVVPRNPYVANCFVAETPEWSPWVGTGCSRDHRVQGSSGMPVLARPTRGDTVTARWVRVGRLCWPGASVGAGCVHSWPARSGRYPRGCKVAAVKTKPDRYGLHRDSSVEPLAQAFLRGRRRRIPGNVRKVAAQMAAKDAHEKASALVRRATGNDDLLLAAEQLGFAHLVATLSDQRGSALNALAVLGHAYARWSSTNGDAVRQAAHDQLCAVAEAYERLGDLRSAAIYRTNAATALLEKRTVTEVDVARADEHLAFSRQHKDPASVDWAYTEFSAGLCEVKRRAVTPLDYVANLQEARSHFDAALDLFAHHQVTVPATVFGEYAHLLATQIDAARDHRVAEAVLTHLDDLPAEIVPLATEDPVRFGEGIDRNPALMGFAEPPGWLTEAIDAPLDAATAADLAAAARRIDEALAQPGDTDRSGLQHAQWWLARVRWEVHKSADNLETLVAAAEAMRDEPDPQAFIERAVYACWDGRIHLGTAPPPALLGAIAHAYLRLIDNGTDDAQIASFIKTYDHQVRFIACSLADQALWDDAVAVLEATRVLLYRSAADASTIDRSEGPSQTSWVYITHSPEASYVIVVRNGQRTRGHVISSLSGKHLAASTLSILQGQAGLFSAQWGNVTTGLTEAVTRIITELGPIADAITALAPDRDGLMLLPSGLYAGMPVAAVVSETAPDHYAFIATAPARHTVDTRPHTWRLCDTTMHALCAARSPGARQLHYSEPETHAIVACLPAVSTRTYNDISCEQFPSAAADCNVLHYSGHSYSNSEHPLQSALVLHDGEFTLGRLIAEARPDLAMVTLSSCQSSSPAISGLSSESLGLHSAFLYTGSSFVVGSLWPVYDITAAVFMTRFYATLATSDILGLPSISAAVRSTQQWMKTATRADISAFLTELNPPIALPTTMVGVPDDAAPFADARNWAPFYVAASRL